MSDSLKDKVPALTRGCSSRGASMGRMRVGDPNACEDKVYLEPILDQCPAACGAYDYEGAYWGCGEMVWRGTGYDAEGDAFEFTFRAPEYAEEAVIEAAKEHLSEPELLEFEIIQQRSDCVQNGGCEYCCGEDSDEDEDEDEE